MKMIEHINLGSYSNIQVEVEQKQDESLEDLTSRLRLCILLTAINHPLVENYLIKKEKPVNPISQIGMLKIIHLIKEFKGDPLVKKEFRRIKKSFDKPKNT